MRLGMVRTAAGEPSVAIQRGDDWLPLLEAPGAGQLGPARTDLLAFLAAGEHVHQLAQELAATDTPSAEPAPPCSACRSARRRSATAHCGRST